MFHAWGFSQLVFAASMACTVVTRRKFDPEATLALVDRHRATGLCVVPVMFDRIMELPDDVRARYSGRSLRFAAASGSRMRPDVVTKFMDQFGDVIYNNYNATEAGMIATATPADLRAAPDTAGRPAGGHRHPHPRRRLQRGARPARWAPSTCATRRQFDGYTSGATKDFHEGYMSSGDVGYLDDAGRLFVVGRDDEMIVSGGENVYPIEVEKTLAAHPEVAEAAVHRRRRRTVRSAARGVRRARRRRVGDAGRTQGSTCARTWRTTRCRGRSSSSTNCRAAALARSFAVSFRTHATAMRRRRASPAARDRRTASTLPTRVRPLGREGYITLPVFAFGWPTSEAAPVVARRVDARRGPARPAGRLHGARVAGSRWR